MTDNIRQIAIYGKGGIGKSTIACNLSIALQEMGRKVMQIGCSPKVDSTAFLMGGEPQDYNILEQSRILGVNEEAILQTIQRGYRDILCVEAGGPEPAEGCAGRGSALALDLLSQYNVFNKFQVDVIIYDVIGDVVCGGFAQPMRIGYAREVYLVTSGEMMSLYSANNVCIAISDIAKSNRNIGVGGLINNMRGVEKEIDLVHEFADIIGLPVMANIPRSDLIQEAESIGGTIMQIFPESELAQVFRLLAKNILEGSRTFIPRPMELSQIMNLLRKYQAIDENL